MNSGTKLQVSKGCTDFLVREVEQLRRKTELMGAQLDVMNSFFSMVDRIGPKHSQGYSPDDLYQTKKEIAEAEASAESKEYSTDEK